MTNFSTKQEKCEKLATNVTTVVGKRRLYSTKIVHRLERIRVYSGFEFQIGHPN